MTLLPRKIRVVHVTGVSRDKLRWEISITKGEKAMRFFILPQLETVEKKIYKKRKPPVFNENCFWPMERNKVDFTVGNIARHGLSSGCNKRLKRLLLTHALSLFYLRRGAYNAFQTSTITRLHVARLALSNVTNYILLVDLSIACWRKNKQSVKKKQFPQ